MEETEKFKVAMWVLKVIKSCKTHSQIRSCKALIHRHLDIFHDYELGQILYKNMDNKRYSCNSLE